MNAIATFRMCDLQDAELLKRIDALTDKMYQTGKIPDRQIPARPNEDFDLLIGELILRYKMKIENSSGITPAP